MNEQGMRKIVAKIPEKKRKEMAAALQKCKTREDAAKVVAKYASFIPKDKVKEIFDRMDNMKDIDYNSLSKTAEDLIESMKKSK